MSDLDKVNGHQPTGLLPMAFAAALTSSADAAKLPFDLDAALSSVVQLHADIPADGYTAPFLGTERDGNGVIIDDDGLILTIGYLIVEAMAIVVSAGDGRMVTAEVVAYDYDSGFGLVRAREPLGLPALAHILPRAARALTRRGQWPLLVSTLLIRGLILLGLSGRSYALGSGNMVRQWLRCSWLRLWLRCSWLHL